MSLDLPNEEREKALGKKKTEERKWVSGFKELSIPPVGTNENLRKRNKKKERVEEKFHSFLISPSPHQTLFDLQT